MLILAGVGSGGRKMEYGPSPRDREATLQDAGNAKGAGNGEGSAAFSGQQEVGGRERNARRRADGELNSQSK
jgi:hypothetical protein